MPSRQRRGRRRNTHRKPANPSRTPFGRYRYQCPRLEQLKARHSSLFRKSEPPPPALIKTPLSTPTQLGTIAVDHRAPNIDLSHINNHCDQAIPHHSCPYLCVVIVRQHTISAVSILYISSSDIAIITIVIDIKFTVGSDSGGLTLEPLRRVHYNRLILPSFVGFTRTQQLPSSSRHLHFPVDRTPFRDHLRSSTGPCSSDPRERALGVN